MADTPDIPAWIALFLGLYALAAAVGELRTPGGWAKMLADVESGAALRFLTGLFCLAWGAAIYLASPWRPGDWLSVAISIIGGLCVAEGLLILAAGERFLHFGRALMNRAGPAWAGFSALLGVVLVIVALMRLGTL